MPLVVGVAFRPVTKIYYFDPAGFDDLAAGDNVVVETSRGGRWDKSCLPRAPCPHRRSAAR